MLQKLLWLAIAGAAGTLCRYGLSGLAHRVCGESFPWGTLAVNLSGCFVFGVIFPLAEERLVISGETRLIILTGFLGAFTTFSSFAYQTCEQLRDAGWLLAAANVAVNNLGGALLIFLGMAIGKHL